MPEAIEVLDHGFVRLVDHMGSDLSVVRAARVSFDAAWRAGLDEGSDKKLIHYLWKHKHTTPFEAVTFTFEIKAPIFVFRQWHRHRTWSYNELSARYQRLSDEYYLPDPSVIGIQSSNNKQGRDLSRVDLAKRGQEVILLQAACEQAFRTYNSLLNCGWPRELARSILPVNTYSHMFGTVNLLNLMKFLTLRCDEHAQYEIQVYANALLTLIIDIVPVSIEAWTQQRETN